MSWMSPLTVPMTSLPARGAPVSASSRAEDLHAALQGVGGLEDFRHEQDAVAKVDADDAHALDQRVGQDRVGSPAALQQDVDALLDLLLEAVVEVVVHLLDEIGVAQLAENDFVVRHGHCPDPGVDGAGPLARWHRTPALQECGAAP